MSSWGIRMELLRIAMHAPCHQGEGSLHLAHADGPPCDAWHSSLHLDRNNRLFHSDVSQPQFYPADVPPSPDISHPAPAARWERRTIQLSRTDMSGSFGSAYPENIRSRQFRFPRQLDSSDTRDSPDPFPPTIKKITLTILTTKSLELSLIFNARYIRQDIPSLLRSPDTSPIFKVIN